MGLDYMEDEATPQILNNHLIKKQLLEISKFLNYSHHSHLKHPVPAELMD